MAKVTLPLMSASASGRFADNIVFDKRGHVRIFTAPVQPNTPAQVAARDLLAVVAKNTGKISKAEALAALRSTLTYKWFSALLGKAVSLVDDAQTNYALFSVQDKSDWDEAATGTGLVAGVAGGTVGFSLYLLALASSELHVEGSPLPAGNQAATCANFFFE